MNDKQNEWQWAKITLQMHRHSGIINKKKELKPLRHTGIVPEILWIEVYS